MFLVVVVVVGVVVVWQGRRSHTHTQASCQEALTIRWSLVGRGTVRGTSLSDTNLSIWNRTLNAVVLLPITARDVLVNLH